MKNGLEFQEAVRKINCLEREDFLEIFKDDYIWNKFVVHLNKDVFELICYLDGSNIQALYSYLIKK